MRQISDWPRFALPKQLIVRIGQYKISSQAAEIAFYLLLALFPFMIFLISLFGLFSQSTPFRQDILSALAGIMPAPIYSVLSDILQEILASHNITFLSVSMLGVIWAASKGFSIILQGLNQIYRAKTPINRVLLRITGMGFALLLVLAIWITMILITFGDLLFQQLARWSGQAVLSGQFIQVFRYIFSFAFLLVVFTLLFYLVSRRKGGFCRALPGAAFTAGSWILFSVVFSWYLNHFGLYAKLYGSLAGMIILMLWLYFCSMMILTGGLIHQFIIEQYQSNKPPDKQ